MRKKFSGLPLRSGFPAVAACFLMFCTAVCSHGGGSVEIEHAFILGHSHMNRRWGMVQVDLKNSGASEAELTVVFSVRRGMSNIHYRRRFFIPGNVRRRLWFPAQLLDSQSYRIELADDEGRSFSDYEILSASLPPHRTTMLRLDLEDVMPSLAADDYAVITFPPGSGRPASLSTSAAHFPDHPAGLDAVDVVMAGALDYEAFRPRQVSALESWIRDGGVFVIILRPDSFENGLGPLERLSPALPYGVRKERVFHLLSDRGSSVAEMDNYVDVIEMEPLPGAEPILSQDGFNLMVRKPMGRGMVYAVAFPGSVIDGLDIGRNLMADIMTAGVKFKPVTESRFHQHGPLHMDRVAGTEVPAKHLVFGVAGGFVIFSAVLLLLFHWRGKGELAWVLILPVGLAITGVFYSISSSYKEEVGFSLNEIAVLHGISGTGDFTRDALVGLFAPSPVRTDIRGSSACGSVITADITDAEEGKVIERNVEVGDVLTVRGLRVAEGGFPRFVSRTKEQFSGPLNITVVPSADGLVATVENRTGMRLEGCFFTAGGYPFPVGDLEDGEETAVVLSERAVGPKWNFTTRAVLGPEGQAKKEIAADMFRPAIMHHSAPWQRHLFFIAWMPGEADFMSEELVLSGRGIVAPARRSMSMLSVHTRIGDAEPGSAVRIPGALNTAGFQLPESRVAHCFSAVDASITHAGLDLVFFMPRIGRSVALESGRLRLDMNTGGREVGLYGVADGETVPVGTLSGADIRHELEIGDIGRFYDARENLVRLHLSSAVPEPADDFVEYRRSRLRNASLLLDGVMK